MREMIGPWNCLAMGRIAGCTPSTRVLTCTASSWVSMWMSLARRWIAVKIVESIRRMTGLISLVSRSTVRLSRRFVFLQQLQPKAFGRILQHALRALALLQDRLDRRPRTDGHL